MVIEHVVGEQQIHRARLRRQVRQDPDGRSWQQPPVPLGGGQAGLAVRLDQHDLTVEPQLG
jgi:hypothetical protein